MEHLILESGGTISFVFHCLLILFFAYLVKKIIASDLLKESLINKLSKISGGKDLIKIIFKI